MIVNVVFQLLQIGRAFYAFVFQMEGVNEKLRQNGVDQARIPQLIFQNRVGAADEKLF